DQGWCSGTLAFDIRGGNVDGTDVGGTKAALTGDWPGGFLGGNGTGRVYFDPAVAQPQRTALEAVFSGQKGGVFEAIAGLVTKWQPAKEAPINIQKGAEEIRVTVGNFGELVVKPLVGPNVQPTTLHNAAAA